MHHRLRARQPARQPEIGRPQVLDRQLAEHAAGRARSPSPPSARRPATCGRGACAWTRSPPRAFPCSPTESRPPSRRRSAHRCWCRRSCRLRRRPRPMRAAHRYARSRARRRRRARRRARVRWHAARDGDVAFATEAHVMVRRHGARRQPRQGVARSLHVVGVQQHEFGPGAQPGGAQGGLGRARLRVRGRLRHDKDPIRVRNASPGPRRPGGIGDVHHGIVPVLLRAEPCSQRRAWRNPPAHARYPAAREGDPPRRRRTSRLSRKRRAPWSAARPRYGQERPRARRSARS